MLFRMGEDMSSVRQSQEVGAGALSGIDCVRLSRYAAGLAFRRYTPLAGEDRWTCYGRARLVGKADTVGGHVGRSEGEAGSDASLWVLH